MTGYEGFIRERMGDKRYRHSLAVSRQAVLLALKHGADPQKAALAGLLHDVCKEFSQEKQLEIIKKHDIVLSSGFFPKNGAWQGSPAPQMTGKEAAGIAFPGVLHQISGPLYLQDELGIREEEVLNAVRWHTTGRPGMGLLEKILFVADVTSEDRDYGDVEHYRALALDDLDEAVFQVLRFILGDLAKREAAVCPDTVYAYNDSLRKRRGKSK